VSEHGFELEGTGIFATDEQVKEAQRRVHHAAYASGMELLPAEKIVHLALDAGVEPRDDGKTRPNHDLRKQSRWPGATSLNASAATSPITTAKRVAMSRAALADPSKPEGTM
jgi:hypothetical protein